MSKSDQQPLLPTHVNHQNNRLSTTRISFPSSSSSALQSPGDDEDSTLVGSSVWSSGGRRRSLGLEPIREGQRQGLPRLSRECLWSEIKCYGSYILPVLLIFGVLVVGASLAAVGWKRGWFSD